MNTLLKVLNSNFRKLVVELDYARFENVPTYAPKAFNKALEYYKESQKKFSDLEEPSEINKNLELALETLKKARIAAETSEIILSEVVQERGEINKNEQVRYRSPEKLNEAEQAYRQATELAEVGKSKAAVKCAINSLSHYREAKLTAYEGRLIKNLENQLQYTKDWLEPEAHEKALAIISSLKDDMRHVRAGNLDVSRLTTKITIASNKINSIVQLDTGLGINNDFPISPDRVFDPGPPGWAPGTFGPPTAPVTMRITDRSVDTLTFIWRNIPSNADTNFVMRREEEGPWVIVAQLGVLGEWQSHTDSDGLQPDRLYCYRIMAGNNFGSRSTPYSKRACGYTKDGNDLTIGRIQIRIRVADLHNGGSPDPVSVRLNSPLVNYSPSSNNTWLDYGPDYNISGGSLQISDDFDRGREFTYDLKFSPLMELCDITMISFKKEGSNALAIAELALFVNGVLVFDRFFGETSSTAIWLHEYYTIFHSELRSNNNWPTTFPLPNFQIPNQELVDRLEGIIGDQIHGTELYWGGLDGSDWVKVTQVDASTLHVTVDLMAEFPVSDIEVDIAFDLNVAMVCSGTTATLLLTTSNFNPNVSFSILSDILSLGVVEFFDDDIEKIIEAAWQPIAKSIDFATQGLCPVVEVDQNGNLNFRLG